MSKRKDCINLRHSLVGQGSNDGVDQQLNKSLGCKHEANLNRLPNQLIVQFLLLLIEARVVKARRRHL